MSPSPTDVYGTLDTSGTAGGAHARVETVTPIFDAARAEDLAVAQRALDPDDPTVHASMVVLPTGQPLEVIDPDKAAERVHQAAKAAQEKLAPRRSRRRGGEAESKASDENASAENPTEAKAAADAAEALKAAGEPTRDEGSKEPTKAEGATKKS